MEMVKKVKKRVELLSPAGNMDAFRAAVNAGADAVYLAGKHFGARAFAENFSDEELMECIDEAHLCGVRINLTVNTLTREKEIRDIVDFVGPLAERGLDGVIVQDIGVMKILHESFPGLPIHASTQLSVTNADAVRFLMRLGVTRVVPARELGIEEIKSLKSELPVEVETFIHGAMCYCYSGKCLMSSFLGGRSGNRGMCAQPCRLPYRILDREGKKTDTGGYKKECYPLAMRDMCTLEILPELIESGIDSFKIEGRMKKPEYTAGVTEVYRKYIDLYYRIKDESPDGIVNASAWRIDSEDMEFVKSLYLRSELSTGYYDRRNGRDMIALDAPGYSGADDALLIRLHDQYVVPIHKVSINEGITLSPGTEASLTVSENSEDGISVTARGAVAMEAIKAPLSEQSVEKSLRKTGDTVFIPDRITVDAGNNSFMPVSAINELRRDALEKIKSEMLERYIKNNSETQIYDMDTQENLSLLCDPDKICFVSEGRLMAVVTGRGQALAAREGGADIIADDSGDMALTGEADILAFPYVIRKTDGKWMLKALSMLSDGTYRGALVRNIEALEFLRHNGYKGAVITDSSVYCWNMSARDVVRKYADQTILPLELDEYEAKDLNRDGRSRLFVYGRVPMMITANCIRKTAGTCENAENGFYELKDRKDKNLPVRTLCTHCQNIIYNSVPVSLHKALTDSNRKPVGLLLMSFTTESDKLTLDVSRVFRRIADGLPVGEMPVTEYTNGHFHKGAE